MATQIHHHEKTDPSYVWIAAVFAALVLILIVFFLGQGLVASPPAAPSQPETAFPEELDVNINPAPEIQEGQ